MILYSSVIGHNHYRDKKHWRSFFSTRFTPFSW